MRSYLGIALAAVLLVPLAACGNKGKLKSPTQIEREEAKKAAKAKKQDASSGVSKDSAAEEPQ